MLQIFGQFSLYGLLGLLVYNLIVPLFNKDESIIWRPLTFISLVYFYYIIVTYFWGDTDRYGLGDMDNTYYTLSGAFLSYVSILVGFRGAKIKDLRYFNDTLSNVNYGKAALCLLIIALAGHIPFHGLQLSVFANDEAKAWEKAGDFSFYFDSLIALGCASSCLAINSQLNKFMKYGTILLFFILYIVGGFRFRIVLLAISIFTVIHLFPSVKRINYKIVVPLTIFLYFLFGLMDGARRYGAGLDRNAVANFDLRKQEGSKENSAVFSFSGYAMNKTTDNYIYIEPVWCTITMPIPRVLWKDKPNADYLRRLGSAELGGAAMLYYAEGYMAFGWIGVCLYGFILGVFAKKIWGNYKLHPNNLGAVLLLALFNALTYFIISRGYLPQTIINLVYFIILPYLFINILKKKIHLQ